MLSGEEEGRSGGAQGGWGRLRGSHLCGARLRRGQLSEGWQSSGEKIGNTHGVLQTTRRAGEDLV